MTWPQAIMFVISMVMQVMAAKAAKKRQAKAEREAKERADAAKGFQISTEGEASLLPIVYGRNLIGGVRVFHNTSNNLTITQPTGNGQLFQNSMATSRVGVKHEFLTVQTALCFGDIQSCQTILVDGRLYSDAKFNSVIGSSEYLDEGRIMGGHRFHVYPSGGVADTFLSNNYSLNRPFTNTAYATAVYGLNRDDYQYNGVPDVKFMVEGLLVYKVIISNGVYQLSTSKSYSNNPAYCLLDYLINQTYGRGLSIEDMDLPSFYYAANLCDKIVVTNAPIDGEFWKAKLAVGATRNIKLYECNIALSPAKTIRDNVEIILETMGQAELVWSGGKYKLILEYPEIYQNSHAYSAGTVVQYNNDLYRAKLDTTSPAFTTIANDVIYMSSGAWLKDVIAAYLIDDDIIRTSENTVSWPNASERYNYVTVRYLNEAKDFVEDSVSWPYKEGSIPGPAIDRGVWDVTKVYGRSDIVTFTDAGIINQYQNSSGLLYAGNFRSDVTYVVNERTLYNGNHYKLSVAPADGVHPLPTDTTYWVLLTQPSTTLAPNIDSAWVLYNDQNVYNIYRKEDSGIPLEADFFESGITDYYHALAKAEQRVRFSRDSTTYKILLSAKYTYLEPGDLIKVDSGVLKLPGEMMRIDIIKVLDNGNAEITATKFDARTLAWNANDNEVVAPHILFDEGVPQCTGLVFTPVSVLNPLSSGRLTWVVPKDIRIVKFIVYYTEALVTTSGTLLNPIYSVPSTAVWNSLGETTNNYFDLPSMATKDYALAVAAVFANGAISPKDELNSKWQILPVGLIAATIDASMFVNVTVYARSVGLPATPTGGIFDFSVPGLTQYPTSGALTWSGSPPAGSAALYGSSAIAESASKAVPDSTLTWTVPALYSDVRVNVLPSKTVLGVGADFNGVLNIFTEATGNIKIDVDGTDLSGTSEATYSITNIVNCSVAPMSTANDANKSKYTVDGLTDLQGRFTITAHFRGVDYPFIITVIAIKDVYIKDTTPPPAPNELLSAPDTGKGGLGLVVNNGYSISGIAFQTIPTYTQGHGHKATVVYAATGVNSTFANAIEVARFSGVSFVLPAELNNGDKRLWFRNLSVDDVLSSKYCGATGAFDVATQSNLANGFVAKTAVLGAAVIDPNLVTSVYRITIYRQIANATAPTGGTYNFSTGLFTPPAGWSATMPSSTLTATYASSFTFSTSNTALDLTGGTWSTPVVVAQLNAASTGVNGVSTYVMDIYSSGVTATPVGGIYNFNSDAFTNVPAGWSRNQPASSSSVATYKSSCTFTTSTAQNDVNAGTWSTPIIVAINGTNGTIGYSAMNAVVSNEAHVIATDNAGNNGNYTGSGTTIKVYEGTTELTYDGVGTANGTWRVTPTSTGIAVGALTDSGTYLTVGDHNSMSADVGLISYTISGKRAVTPYDPFTLTTTQSFSKAKSGINGVDSASYWLVTSTPVLVKSTTGIFTPGNVTLSAMRQLGAAVPVAYSGRLKIYENGSATASYTSASDEVAAKIYTPSSGAVTTIKVELYQSGGVTVKIDEQTISVVNDGVNGVNALSLVSSNEAHTIPTDNAGNNGNYSNSGTTLQLFEGTTPLLYDGVGTANGTWKVTAGALGITVGTLSDLGDYVVVGNHSLITLDSAFVSYTVTGKRANGTAFTLTSTQTISRVKAGAAGPTSPIVTISGDQIFKYAAGVATPTSLNSVLSAITSGITSPTYSWEYWNGTTWTALSAPQNTISYTLAHNNAAWGTNDTLRVRCVSGGVFDDLTITKVRDAVSQASTPGARGAGVFYANIAIQGWDNIIANNRIQTVTKGSVLVSGSSAYNVEGDTVTEILANTWTMTKIWSAGAWVASGEVIDSNLIVTGSIDATKVNVSSMRAALITAGLVTADVLNIGGQSISGALNTANLGDITAGTITLGTAGFIKGGQTAYATGDGFWLGKDTDSIYKFSIGNATQGFTWDGASATFKGALNAATGTFSGNLSAAGGTFAGALSAASGTFSGNLNAAGGSFGGQLLVGVIDFTIAAGITNTYAGVVGAPTTQILTVPAGKTSMRVTLIGGGGAGGSTGSNWWYGGHGGYAATVIKQTFSNLVAGAQYTLTLGKGGVCTGVNMVTGDAGGATSIVATIGGAVLITTPGGAGGVPYFNPGSAAGMYWDAAHTLSIYDGQKSDLGTGGRNDWVSPAKDATGYGAGGGGAASGGTVSPPNHAGGNGAPGYAIIEFYNPNAVVLSGPYSNLKASLTTQLKWVDPGNT